MVECGSEHDAISVSVSNNQIFGNYTWEGFTPLICVPGWNSCYPFIVIPEGCHAVVTWNG